MLSTPGDYAVGRATSSPHLKPYFRATLFDVGRPYRWYRSARRHRIGKAHAMHVIATAEPRSVLASDAFDARLVWIGEDDRGIELEIVALDLPDAIVVIHAMPTSLRR